MIDQKEFDRRVAQNYKTFNRETKNNTFTPSSYFLFDKNPRELTTLQCAKRIHDIYASVVCGILAISEITDKDAASMKNNKITKIELKTSYLETKNVFKTRKGKGIYTGYRSPLDNYIRAKFSSYHEPDMPVYFIVGDTSGKWGKLDLIGVWQMDGKTVNEILEKTKNRVTLKNFINLGKRKVVKVNTIGYSKWFNTMFKRVPIKRCTQL